MSDTQGSGGGAAWRNNPYSGPYTTDAQSDLALYSGVLTRRFVAFLIDLFVLSVPIVLVSIFILLFGVVTLVFNNNAYGNVRRDQIQRFDGRVVASDLVNPDFVKLAESLGVVASRVTSPDGFRPALEKALAHGGPYLIDVEVPRDSEVTPWTFIHPAKP